MTPSLCYRLQEGQMTLSGDWQDQSMNLFVPQQVKAQGTNLVVVRDKIPLGMSFTDYIVQQKASFATELPGFTLIDSEEVKLDQRPATYLEFSWNNGGKKMQQLMVVAPCDGKALSFTATMPGEPDPEVRRMLLSTIKSFRFDPTTPQNDNPAA